MLTENGRIPQRKLKRQVESLSEMLAISNIERDKMAEVLQHHQKWKYKCQWNHLLLLGDTLHL